MSDVDRGQGGGGKSPAARGQEALHDRLPGERVPERERLAVDAQQLMVGSPFQAPGDDLRSLTGGLGQQTPIELPPENGGAGEDYPLAFGKIGQPGPDAVPERARDAR